MFGVIMAGGRGTRFWPSSRKNNPKQLLDKLITLILDSLELITNALLV